MPTELPNIGKTAKNALKTISISTLEQLAMIDEDSLLKLHGIGPKAVRIIKTALQDSGLALREKPFHPFAANFLIIGDLKCDNAPKRRVIRDYLILSCMEDKKQLLEVVKEDVSLNSINNHFVQGIDAVMSTVHLVKEPLSSLEITRILSHGKEGAAHGTVTFNTGTQVHFAEFYTFENNKKDARIKSITRYIIQ